MLEKVEEQITKEQWKSDLKHANCFGLSSASPSLGQARHCIFNRLYAPVQEIISGVITSKNTTSILKDIADKHLKLVKAVPQEVSDSKHDSDYWWQFNQICNNF